MDVDFDWLKLAWGVILTIAQFAIGVILWLDRGRKDNRAKFKEINVRQDGFDRRLIVAEQQVQNLPNHEDIDDLEAKLSGVQADMAGIRATLQGVQNTSDRIYEYLLNNGK